MLLTLLDSIRMQDCADRCRLTAVVVIDNDEQESARTVVEGCRPDYPCPLLYDCVPQRNIAHARNRGVALALCTDADALAFIDDDCVASPTWLRELTRTSEAFDADIVWGRLSPQFQPGTPDWIVRGGFFGQPDLPTGTVMPTAESNNALVRSTVLRTMTEPFDPAFGQTGGSDSVMFARARQQGARIIWANDAIVTEKIPPSRANARWLLQRSFRMGNAGVFLKRSIERFWLPERFMKAFVHLGYGLVTLLPAVVRGRGPMLRSLRSCSQAAGMFTALLGHRYVEYRRVHGG